MIEMKLIDYILKASNKWKQVNKHKKKQANGKPIIGNSLIICSIKIKL